MANDVSGAVVVGYDASEQSKAAVEWAADEARRREVELVVVHGVRRPERGADRRAQEVADRIAEDGAERARAHAPGLRVRAVMKPKGPAAALQELSQDAALLVVGNSGRGRIGLGLLGSVATAVSTYATCPVVVVRGHSAHHPGPGYPVVVGTDGSEVATKAVGRAADVAADTGARLVIAGAWQAPEGNPWAPGYLANPDANRRDAEAAERAAREAVAQAQAAVRRRYTDLEVEAGTREGRPEHVLTDLSEGAGVVVVGARGQSDLAAMLLGSVGRAVMHSARCPVAIVR